MGSAERYSFPKLKKVTIRSFSLFTKDGKVPELDEAIKEGVYCLAGANGIGKTTFLTAINYGLTGIVLESNKEVYSPKEILKNNKRYTERYFDGRVQAQHKDNSEIEITFQIKDKYYKITRGFFRWQELRQLEIYKIIEGKKISFIDTSDLSPNGMNDKYREELAKDVGLKSFDDFIFLQLYIFTFDENRRGIFWDERGSQIALSTAFYSDKNDAERLSELKRLWEKFESNGRNIRWQATQTQNKMNELIKLQNHDQNQDSEDLMKAYDDIQKNHESASKNYESIKAEHDHLLRIQSTLNSEIMHLRKEHRKLFSLYNEPRSRLIENTDVKMSLEKKECFLCGAVGESVKISIENNVHKSICPICSTGIVDEEKEKMQESAFKEIERLDKEISSRVQKLDNAIIEEEEKAKSLSKAEFEFQEVDNKLKEFESDNPAVSLKNPPSQSVKFLIDQYKEQYNKLIVDSRTEYGKRDDIKPEYKKLQNKLRQEYSKAEKHFVPIFQELAKSFIGLPLTINLSKRENTLMFYLSLNDIIRTEFHQLSESQRYFLDIALRMALAIYMSQQKQEAAMFIDTPEGSLDIAYESRAGKMFANFVKKNHPLLMTANINASQLLLVLAKECGEDKMNLRRMIEWTDLSEVQKEGEKLFDKAYHDIENAMKGANQQ